MSNNNKEFKALKDTWYKKLEDEGFEDIEQEDGNLKVWASFKVAALYRKKSKTYFEVRESYYRLAGFFAHEYKFDTSLEEFMWRKHSEGHSTRTISKLLKEQGITKDHCTVFKFLKKHKNIMYHLYAEKEINE